MAGEAEPPPDRDPNTPQKAANPPPPQHVHTPPSGPASSPHPPHQRPDWHRPPLPPLRPSAPAAPPLLFIIVRPLPSSVFSGPISPTKFPCFPADLLSHSLRMYVHPQGFTSPPPREPGEGGHIRPRPRPRPTAIYRATVRRPWWVLRCPGPPSPPGGDPLGIVYNSNSTPHHRNISNSSIFFDPPAEMVRKAFRLIDRGILRSIDKWNFQTFSRDSHSPLNRYPQH